jgi:outer membrane protein assembly factor BamD
VLVLEDDGERHRLGAEGRLSAVGTSSTSTRWPAAPCATRLRRAVEPHVAASISAAGGCARTRARARPGLVQPLAVQRARHDGARGARSALGAVGALGLRRVGRGSNHIIRAHLSDGRRRLARHSVMIQAFVFARSAREWRWPRARRGCGSTPKDEPRLERREIVCRGQGRAAQRQLRARRKLLERLEGRAAGTLLAQQAQLERAYCSTEERREAQALSTLERFIKLHPTSPALDYALYLQGLINFNDNLGCSAASRARTCPSATSRPRATPTSRSSSSSTSSRSRATPRRAAAHELHRQLARRLRGARRALLLPPRRLRRRANRAQQAVQEFQQSPSTEEALFIMAQSYDKLGLTELRDDAERVLRQNFPNAVLTPSLHGARAVVAALVMRAAAERQSPRGELASQASASPRRDARHRRQRRAQAAP